MSYVGLILPFVFSVAPIAAFLCLGIFRFIKYKKNDFFRYEPFVYFLIYIFALSGQLLARILGSYGVSISLLFLAVLIGIFAIRQIFIDVKEGSSSLRVILLFWLGGSISYGDTLAYSFHESYYEYFEPIREVFTS